MTQKWRQRCILAVAETTYGTDPTPTGASNAILCSEPTIRPLEGGTVDRQLLYPTMGASPLLHVNSHVVVEFGVELAGSGTAGTAPAYAPLLLACGLAETVVESTSAAYQPDSDADDSVTIYFHIGGSKHALTGARGNARLVLPSNDVPRIMFTFTGLWVDPAAASQPTPDFSSFTAPLTVSKTNTPTGKLHTLDAVIQSLEIDLGNVTPHRDLINSKAVPIADRQTTGRIVIEAPALGTKNFFTIAKAGSLGALQLVHGTTAGNICTIDAPKVQVLNPTYSESDSIAMLNMDLRLTRDDEGDDELVLTFT